MTLRDQQCRHLPNSRRVESGRVPLKPSEPCPASPSGLLPSETDLPVGDLASGGKDGLIRRTCGTESSCISACVSSFFNVSSDLEISRRKLGVILLTEEFGKGWYAIDAGRVLGRNFVMFTSSSIDKCSPSE